MQSARIQVGILLLVATALNAFAQAPAGLNDPAKKDIAMQLVSSAENSSLNWKSQYAYIEYNVEKNEKENRGYTAGIIGFTSRTHDMLELVVRYEKTSPDNALSTYLSALRKVDDTPSREGLGKAFEDAWKKAAEDPKFRAAQDAERDRVYFDPAVNRAQADGLHELGQFIYYDAIVMHGPGNGRNSFGGIRKSAMKSAALPSAGGDETAYLNAFLDARVRAMRAEQGHQDTSRVDTMQRRFLSAGNLHLDLPLEFAVYGEKYKIPAVGSEAPAAARTKNVFQRRYVLVFANVGRPADREKILAIARRAAAAGYNGIVLGPRAGEYIDLYARPPAESYVNAFTELRKETDRLHLALIPYAINANEVGYAAPELVEAIPCRDTPFVVHDDVASIDSAVQLLANPGFESFDKNSPADWGHDKPGAITYIDENVKHAGGHSLRIENTGAGDPKNGHGRLWQSVKIKPFRAYEFSVWLKTRDLSDAGHMQFYFQGSDGAQPMVYANREAGFGSAVKPTQDWTQYTVRFNSASNTRLELFFGIWSTQSHGTLWFDDADLHEIGLYHTVRRASLPLTVTAQDGGQFYEEGRDYVVGDQSLTIPKDSHISSDAHLKISWYQRAEMIGPPFANAAHPEYFKVERKIAEKLDGLFARPPGFMMTFDEWRVANWDPAAGNITAGEYVANTVRQSTDLLKQINPKFELYIWSDMFDPNENANKKYFMANGPLTDSWKGLSKDTTIVTWDGAAKALKFFSDLGMKQMIGGYYSSMDNVKEWLAAVNEVEAQGATGIGGFMYTTWDDNFSDIEKVADVIKATGRWQGGPAFDASPK